MQITNIASIIPALETYLKKHPATARTLTSFIPTLLVSILTLLIPLILLIISKVRPPVHLTPLSKP